MSKSQSVVAKVGGSLFDFAGLKTKLSSWLEAQSASKTLLIGGGGVLADGIRSLHKTHRLPEETSHWLAIQTMSINARFLGALLGLQVIDSTNDWQSNAVLDPYRFLCADEGQPGSLPHNWRVTSDSIAARIAILTDSDVTLLKSADLPDGKDWKALADAGYVDHFFPEVVQSSTMKIRCVNLRSFLESN